MSQDVGQGPPASDGPRIPPHQGSELILGLGDQPLQLCDTRRRAGHFGFELPDIQL